MRLGNKLWHNHNDNNDDHRENSYIYMYIYKMLNEKKRK